MCIASCGMSQLAERSNAMSGTGWLNAGVFLDVVSVFGGAVLVVEVVLGLNHDVIFRGLLGF